MKKPDHPPMLVPLWAGRYPDVTFADCTTVHSVQQVTAEVRVPPGNNPAIGEGSFVGLNVEFRGTVVVGKDCVIDKGVILQNCTIGDGCVVGPYAWVQDSELGNDVRVGFHAQVRRSKLADGARMDHHGYVGDASAGEKTTIGAGVVTANFDGTNKNKTIIGRRCLIGVNSSLVAKSPHLRIGDDVVVAAGSAITKDVPSGHTAFGRARQISRKRRGL